MAKDIRKEQLALLRIEKQIAGLAATVAIGATAAKAADGKLHATAASNAYADIQAAVVNLAELVSTVHETLEAHVQDVGAKSLNAIGGVPKEPISESVRSVLGLG